MKSFRLTVMDIRRAGPVLGALAFLIQAVAWATMAPMGGMAAPFTIQICSPEGIKSVEVDQSGRALSPDGKDQDGVELQKNAPETKTKVGHCPLCPVMAGIGLPPAVSVEIYPQSITGRHDARSLPGLLIAAGWFLSTLQARGPPIAG